MPDKVIDLIYAEYIKFYSVQIDSRKVQSRDVFFALTGPSFNGNDFAQDALNAGALCAVVDDPVYLNKERFIVVDDVLNALQLLARHHRRKLNIPIIAITGSNGKTTTKELISAVLSQKYKVVSTVGNLNNHIGVPLTLLNMKPDTEIGVVEMGANHIGEIASYCKVALPDIGLITNCGRAHLEGFGSEEGVRIAKGELYQFIRENNGVVFRNSDLPYLEEMAKGIPSQITYGSANAQIIGKVLKGENSQTLQIAILSSGMEVRINSHLSGDYNFSNLMASVAVGNYYDIGIDLIKKGIENYIPDNNRSQLLKLGSNSIILDAYNANPTSMQLAIEHFASINAEEKWVFLGSMKELGEYSSKEHQAVIDLLQKNSLNNVVLTGLEFDGTTHPYKWFEKVEETKDWIIKNPINHAYVLVKGSRGANMEKIMEAFNQ